MPQTEPHANSQAASTGTPLLQPFGRITQCTKIWRLPSETLTIVKTTDKPDTSLRFNLRVRVSVRVRVISNGGCYFVDDERVQSTNLSEVLVQDASFALKAHQGMRLRCDISFS